mmetsp:Transcript_47881/g.70867  ORF Transcript_47881/g.70867 Transcript_47881/m.70867 type:complete len:161 (+) Transcript_47881:62-544(+)|eukprot:CAMPEP_0195528940 /NCGR_PEP_ID=MMETSP0794_2-20130614/31304_1 /TAXON_ID=515487 /ORGANISM="Stephanopyxis turris, Strain CCMP 815" /LENGTH=160 /DNA_ID=CAMNT_0040660161 /DNA_START=60 /DNA_END=542 /DNA_ORIENTATION=+
MKVVAAFFLFWACSALIAPPHLKIRSGGTYREIITSRGYIDEDLEMESDLSPYIPTHNTDTDNVHYSRREQYLSSYSSRNQSSASNRRRARKPGEGMGTGYASKMDPTEHYHDYDSEWSDDDYIFSPSEQKDDFSMFSFVRPHVIFSLFFILFSAIAIES